MAESDEIEILKGRRNRLKAALASGAQSISYGDYHKTFRSVDEIREALADVEGDLAALGCGRRFARAYRFTSHKDL